MQPAPALNGTIRFGVFELDLRAGELRKQGVKLKLQDQPLQILQLLIGRRGEVVSREELRQRIWPADTFVDFDHGINNAIKRLREVLGDTAETPQYIETLPRRGYRWIMSTEIAAHTPSSHIQSLAVLPLENLSRDPEQEYFADGLTEALITRLAKLSALRVVSRTTAMHYKGCRRPLPEIARELGVDAIVEGTVVRSGERVRISAQLVDARSDSHLWAESYERDLRDVLALQSEVAGAIAQEVRVTLTPRERNQLAQARRVDPEAYENYLKGRYYWNQRGPDSLVKGAEYFRQAIEKDPGYAAAYSGLADCAGVLGWWGLVSFEQGCQRGKALALEALAIDDHLGEAHASLGWNLLHGDFDFSAAEEEFHRALELEPRNPTAVLWHSALLISVSRADDAIAEALRAVQLDPLSGMTNTGAGMIYWHLGDNDRALQQCQKAIELVPDFGPAHWTRAVALVQKGMHHEAISVAENLVRQARVPPFLGLLGHCCAAAGRREEALRSLNELQVLSQLSYVPALWPAVIYASMDEADQALYWLDIAYKERCAWMVYIHIFSWFANLRRDSRFQDLIRRMKFPASAAIAAT